MTSDLLNLNHFYGFIVGVILAVKDMLTLLVDKLTTIELLDVIVMVGFLGGIIGAVRGLFALFDRFRPPSVEILGLRPIVAISLKKEGAFPQFNDKSFHMIIDLKSKGRPVMVNGLILKGKVYLSGNYALSYLDNMSNLDDYEAEYNEKKPYVNVELTASPTDSNLPVKMESHERRYLRVTFGGSYLDGTEIDQTFAGYDDGSRQPSRTMYSPSLLFNDSCKDSDNFNIIKNGPVAFELHVGSKNVPISKDRILNCKIIPKAEWDSYTIDRLYKDI